MGRSILKVVAGCLPTAPAPSACVTRASSPVPKSSVPVPASSPSRRPVTAALGVLVLGTWCGREPWVGGEHLPAFSVGLGGRGGCEGAPGAVAFVLVHSSAPG